MDKPSGKKNVTIHDVAKEAGVSISMVSRVLSGNGSVAKEKRIRIQEVIDRLQYRPNAFARGLQKSRSGIIGFVIPHIGSEYFANTYYEFERHASDHGYMVVVYNGKSTRSVEERIYQRLDEARVEGIVIMGGTIDAADAPQEYVDQIRSLNERIPCVLCSEWARMFDCVGVHGDDRNGAQQVVRYLKEKGYHSVGFLGGYPSSVPTINKSTYLREEAEAVGIEFLPEWKIGNSFDEADGAASMKLLLQQERIPEAVYCINDNVAIGAMGVALDRGMRIPEDISLIGNDGIHLTDHIRPRITTVAIDYKSYGEKLFEAIQSLIDGESCQRQTLITPTLIPRETTR